MSALEIVNKTWGHAHILCDDSDVEVVPYA